MIANYPEESSTRRCQIRRHTGTTSTPATDVLATEEPLAIELGFTRDGHRVHRTISVTLRTPGDDEALAVGFLFAEQIVTDPSAIAYIDTASDRVRVELHPDNPVDLTRANRNFGATAACGTCGKSSLGDLVYAFPKPDSTTPVRADTIHGLPAKLRAAQANFDQTGGIHAAALFNANGTLLDHREDIGRHNAVDKVIGSRLLAGDAPPFADTILFVSSRAGYELIQKALAAGIPTLAAVGAPSSLAVELAQAHDATLIGFVRDGRFNVYTGGHRIPSFS